MDKKRLTSGVKWSKEEVGSKETLLFQLNIAKTKVHIDLKTKTGLLDLEIKVISPRFLIIQ